MKKIIDYLEGKSLVCISLYQALGLVIYCGLVAILFWKGNELFGKVPNYLGPLLFLVLFVVSALISAFIVLGYPFILFWEKKQTGKALKLVGYTIAWLVLFILLIILTLVIF